MCYSAGGTANSRGAVKHLPVEFTAQDLEAHLIEMDDKDQININNMFNGSDVGDEHRIHGVGVIEIVALDSMGSSDCIIFKLGSRYFKTIGEDGFWMDGSEDTVEVKPTTVTQTAYKEV
jgi:hypothetical protein